MMKLSEAANKAIDLGRKVYDYYSVELPKRHPHYPLVEPGDEETPPPPEEKKLKDFLSSLSEEMIYQLMLIMYLGREDFGVEELAAQYDELKGTYGDSEHAALQMMDASLADNLSDGLEELRKHKINPDRMLLKTATRKR